ncbi:hypothetical protein WJX74_004344 [Apatococcus lobatus]|uniref:VTT domain-containing protein n=1 Tax=Apatococcus lobatus TaxID=904363 RepID=A0AAW1RTE6_9CHLO
MAFRSSRIPGLRLDRLPDHPAQSNSTTQERPPLQESTAANSASSHLMPQSLGPCSENRLRNRAGSVMDAASPRSRLASTGWRTAREWANSQNQPPTPPGSMTARSHSQQAPGAALPMSSASAATQPLDHPSHQQLSLDCCRAAPSSGSQPTNVNLAHIHHNGNMRHDAEATLKQGRPDANARGVEPGRKQQERLQANCSMSCSGDGSNRRGATLGPQGVAAARLVSLSPRIQAHRLRPVSKHKPVPSMRVCSADPVSHGSVAPAAGSHVLEQASNGGEQIKHSAAPATVRGCISQDADLGRKGSAVMDREQRQFHLMAGPGLQQLPTSAPADTAGTRPTEPSLPAKPDPSASSSFHSSSCSSSISSGTSRPSFLSGASEEPEVCSQASAEPLADAQQSGASFSHQDEMRILASGFNPSGSTHFHPQHRSEQSATGHTHSPDVNDIAISMDQRASGAGTTLNPRVPMLSLANLQTQRGASSAPHSHNSDPAGGSENVSPNKKAPRPSNGGSDQKQPSQRHPKSPKKSPKKLSPKKPLIPQLSLAAIHHQAGYAGSAAPTAVTEATTTKATPAAVTDTAMATATAQNLPVDINTNPGKQHDDQLMLKSPMRGALIPKLALESIGQVGSTGPAASTAAASEASICHIAAEGAQTSPAAAEDAGSAEQVPTAIYDLMPSLAGESASPDVSPQEVRSLFPTLPVPSADPDSLQQPTLRSPNGPELGLSGYPHGGSQTSRILDPHAGITASSPRFIGLSRSQVQIQPPLTARSRLQTSTTSLDPEPGKIIRSKAAARCGSLTERGSPRTPGQRASMSSSPSANPSRRLSSPLTPVNSRAPSTTRPSPKSSSTPASRSPASPLMGTSPTCGPRPRMQSPSGSLTARPSMGYPPTVPRKTPTRSPILTPPTSCSATTRVRTSPKVATASDGNAPPATGRGWSRTGASPQGTSAILTRAGALPKTTSAADGDDPSAADCKGRLKRGLSPQCTYAASRTAQSTAAGRVGGVITPRSANPAGKGQSSKPDDPRAAAATAAARVAARLRGTGTPRIAARPAAALGVSPGSAAAEDGAVDTPRTARASAAAARLGLSPTPSASASSMGGSDTPRSARQVAAARVRTTRAAAAAGANSAGTPRTARTVAADGLKAVAAARTTTLAASPKIGVQKLPGPAKPNLAGPDAAVGIAAANSVANRHAAPMAAETSGRSGAVSGNARAGSVKSSGSSSASGRPYRVQPPVNAAVPQPKASLPSTIKASPATPRGLQRKRPAALVTQGHDATAIHAGNPDARHFPRIKNAGEGHPLAAHMPAEESVLKLSLTGLGSSKAGSAEAGIIGKSQSDVAAPVVGKQQAIKVPPLMLRAAGLADICNVRGQAQDGHQDTAAQAASRPKALAPAPAASSFCAHGAEHGQRAVHGGAYTSREHRARGLLQSRIPLWPGTPRGGTASATPAPAVSRGAQTARAHCNHHLPKPLQTSGSASTGKDASSSSSSSHSEGFHQPLLQPALQPGGASSAGSHVPHGWATGEPGAATALHTSSNSSHRSSDAASGCGHQIASAKELALSYLETCPASGSPAVLGPGTTDHGDSPTGPHPTLNWASCEDLAPLNSFLQCSPPTTPRVPAECAPAKLQIDQVEVNSLTDVDIARLPASLSHEQRGGPLSGSEQASSVSNPIQDKANSVHQQTKQDEPSSAAGPPTLGGHAESLQDLAPLHSFLQGSPQNSHSSTQSSCVSLSSHSCEAPPAQPPASSVQPSPAAHARSVVTLHPSAALGHHVTHDLLHSLSPHGPFADGSMEKQQQQLLQHNQSSCWQNIPESESSCFVGTPVAGLESSGLQGTQGSVNLDDTRAEEASRPEAADACQAVPAEGSASAHVQLSAADIPQSPRLEGLVQSLCSPGSKRAPRQCLASDPSAHGGYDHFHNAWPPAPTAATNSSNCEASHGEAWLLPSGLSSSAGLQELQKMGMTASPACREAELNKKWSRHIMDWSEAAGPHALQSSDHTSALSWLSNSLHEAAVLLEKEKRDTRNTPLDQPDRGNQSICSPAVHPDPKAPHRSQQKLQCHTRAPRLENSSSQEETSKPYKHWWRIALVLCSFTLFWFCLPDFAAASSTATTSSGNWAKDVLSFVLHIDKHLNDLILQHGRTTYLILWSIVFCETGLVLTPFLPGDSLLFTAGTFAARGSLDLGLLLVTFLTSAILGDAVNYAVGKWLGGKALNYRFINKEYIAKTERYFAKHGGRAIVLARFVPIVRTFAPFVAGIGSMAYREFAAFNVAGAIVWTLLFAVGGFLFGNLPFVQRNLPVVMIAIVLVSVLPLVLEVLEARRESSKAGPTGAASDASS